MYTKMAMTTELYLDRELAPKKKRKWKNELAAF
jgi:hypothetical protein